MEIWKDVIGYKGIYKVSNFGKVNNGYKNLSSCKRRGYLGLTLVKKGNKKNVLVHRLVGKTFIPNPNNKPFINHIDSNRTNNHVDNLEWCTSKENMQHASKNGRLLNHSNKRQSYYNSNKIKVSISKGHIIKKFNSIKDVAQFLNCSSASVSMHLSDKQHRKTICGWVANYIKGDD